MTSNLVAALTTFALSAAATWLVREQARRRGWMVAPRPDRWHQQPTALFGGVAIFVALALGLLFLTPLVRPLPALLLLATGMFLVGLADDVWELRPQGKLVAQLASGLMLHLAGFHFNAELPWLLDLAIVVFWVVAVTNAMNLLDNMNGLCAGVAAIAAVFRWLFYLQDGNAAGAQMSAIFFGAVGGFLLFNFPRASIFMGDAGSFVIGFMLAALNLTSSEVYSKGLLSILFFPVLVLAIPIFDTAFVSVMRWFSGRAVSQGGRDHASHRLVAVGLSETAAVLILFAISIASGSVAFVLYRVGFSYALFMAALLVIGLVLFGVFLASVKVYPEDEVPWDAARRTRAGFTLATDFQYKRLVLWVLVDTLTLLLAWYAAFAVRFGESPAWAAELERFTDSAAIAVASVLLGLFVQGLYRTDWQHFSLHEVRAIVAGTTLGMAATFVALSLAEGLGRYPASVFVIALGGTVLMLAGSRLFVRSLADWLRREPAGAERILIYGAGVGGELALREIRSNAALAKRAVGFIDDDRLRRGMTIHGVPVLGGLSEVERLVERHQVKAIVVSTNKITEAHAARLRDIAAAHGVAIYRIQIAMVPFDGIEMPAAPVATEAARAPGKSPASAFSRSL
jgi:UDP-GlcNAc:undecaprenyl-phosphate GlcNAc-1-phosphate transferase